MAIKRFKFRNILTIAVSLLAVITTGVSTFAWYQLKLGTEHTTSQTVTTGSPDIDVKRIKGFKYEYDEPSKGAINYNSGEITSVTTYDEINDADVTDDMEAVEFDIPKDGTGYYLMGDANFVATVNNQLTPPSNYIDTFAASIKFTRRDTRDTMYYCKNVVISNANEEVRIKNHYFDNQGKTVNTYVNQFTSGGTYSSSLATYTNVTIKGTSTTKIVFTSAGTYNIWYDSNLHKVAVEEVLTISSKNRASMRRTRLNACAANGDPNKIYFKANKQNDWHEFWQQSDPHFKFIFKTSNGSQIGGDVWVESPIASGNYYEVTVPSNAAKVQVCRMDPGNHSSQWNYSGTFDIGSNRGKAFRFTDNDVTNGTTNVSWFDYWIDGFYVVGYGGVFGNGGNSWKASTGFYMSSISDNNYSNSVDITFEGGEYWAMVYRKNNTDYSNSTSYPDKRAYRSGVSNDMSVVEDGNNYQIHNKSGYSATIYRIKNEAASNAGEVYISRGYYQTLTPSYFLSATDGGYRLSLPASASYSYGGTNVTTKAYTAASGTTYANISESFATCQYYDPTNAIWYVFDREGSKWYSDPSCADNTELSGTVTSAGTIYCKMVALPLTTVYADVKLTSWQDMKISAWGAGTGNLEITVANNASAKCLINDTLYRFSIPSSVSGYIVHNGAGGGGSNQSTNVTAFNPTLGLIPNFLKVQANGNSNANWWYDGDLNETHGTLYISRAEDSYATQETYRMGYASSINLAAMEEGVILYEGDVLAVHYYVDGYYFHNTLNTTYSYAEDGITSVKTFNDGNSHTIDTVIRIKKTGRYTVYFTLSGHRVAIAQVPLEGNGYYVMTTTSSSTYTGFENAHRMKTISNPTTNVAYFKNLYVADPTTTYIFVRSYNNNVDVHYTGHHDNDATNINSVLLSTVTGYSSPGYFNIYLFDSTGNGGVNQANLHYSVVATDERDSFFSLNTISSIASIESQQSSLIIETSFTVTSVDSTSISVIVNKTGFSTLGTYAICTDERIEDPYTYMRQRVYGYDSNEDGDYDEPGDIPRGTYTLQSGSSYTFDGLCDTTANNNTKIYYVYIMIDYVSRANNYAPSGSFSFYIQSTQTVS